MGEIIFRYVQELLMLHLGTFVCFDMRMRYPWRQIAGGICCAALFWLHGEGVFPMGIISYAVSAVITFWCMESHGKKEFSQLLLLFVLMTGLEEMIDGPRVLYQVMKGIEVQETIPLAICNWGLRCLLLGLLWAMKKKMLRQAYDRMFHFFRKNLFWMLALVIWHLALSVGLAGYAVKYIPGEQVKFYCFLLDFFGFLSILLLAGFVLFTWEMYQRLLAEQRERETYYRAEKLHYEMLLKNENMTKKYRHDMKNHLVCMDRLARQESWEELQAYLSGMVERMEAIRSHYKTGNQVMDIISDYLLSQPGEHISVRICGSIKDTGSIRQEDLCTIYANLLQNAVEELQRKKDQEEGQLTIHLLEHEHFLQIEIENTLSGPKKDLSTQKADKDQHGFGMGNVRETVKKNHGTMQVEIRENTFYVKVVLEK